MPTKGTFRGLPEGNFSTRRRVFLRCSRRVLFEVLHKGVFRGVEERHFSRCRRRAFCEVSRKGVFRGLEEGHLWKKGIFRGVEEGCFSRC